MTDPIAFLWAEPTPADVLDLFGLLKDHPDYRAFVRAMAESPGDDTTRLVLADWLQERGCEWHAERLRAFRMSAWHEAAKALGDAALAAMGSTVEAFNHMARGFGVMAVALAESLRPLAAALAHLAPPETPTSGDAQP